VTARLIYSVYFTGKSKFYTHILQVFIFPGNYFLCTVFLKSSDPGVTTFI